MKVGFLNNQIDNRGTGNAIFDYAHYNEEILGNESFVLSFPEADHDPKMWERVRKRFGLRFGLIDASWFPADLDVLYHIKSGADDGFRAPHGVRYAVHGVFECPNHGDRNATVSNWLSGRCGVPSVPHIVNLPETTDDLRSALAIRQDAIVFGRHGGLDSFDIPWAWSAINRALKASTKVHFLFMNTNIPDITFYDDKRVQFIPATADPYQKRVFINTCDAMLHARERGETFGIALGEFASVGTPILTYGLSGERNHYEEVNAFLYNNEEELVQFLTDTTWLEDVPQFGYTQYTPEKVMAKFKEVFLDD